MKTNGRIVFCQKFLSALFRLPKIVHLILGFNYFYFCSIIYCCHEVYRNDLCISSVFLVKANRPNVFLEILYSFRILYNKNIIITRYFIEQMWTTLHLSAQVLSWLEFQLEGDHLCQFSATIMSYVHTNAHFPLHSRFHLFLFLFNYLLSPRRLGI